MREGAATGRGRDRAFSISERRSVDAKGSSAFGDSGSGPFGFGAGDGQDPRGDDLDGPQRPEHDDGQGQVGQGDRGVLDGLDQDARQADGGRRDRPLQGQDEERENDRLLGARRGDDQGDQGEDGREEDGLLSSPGYPTALRRNCLIPKETNRRSKRTSPP